MDILGILIVLGFLSVREVACIIGFVCFAIVGYCVCVGLAEIGRIDATRDDT